MARNTTSNASHFNVESAALNQNEVKALLQATLRRGGHPMPICLCGAPGVGKSQIIQQVCREFDVTKENGRYYEVRVSECVDSSDLTGLPVVQKKVGKNAEGHDVDYGHVTTYSTPLRLPCRQYDVNGKEIPNKELHVLFFDEVNRSADPSIMNAIFQMLTEWQIGPHKLVENCVILLAMNPENTGYAVNEICPALVNRMNIQYMKAEVQPWLEWARDPKQGNVSKLVTDFIDSTPNEFAHDGIVTNEGQDKRFPTPRAWVNLDRNLLQTAHLRYNKDKDAAFALKMIAGYVGWGAATKFVSFARTNAEDRPLTGKEVLENYGNSLDMQNKVTDINDNGIRTYDTTKTTTTLNSLMDEFKSRGVKLKKSEIVNLLMFLKDIAPENALSFQNELNNDTSIGTWFFEKVFGDEKLTTLWTSVQDGITKAGVGNQAVL